MNSLAESGHFGHGPSWVLDTVPAVPEGEGGHRGLVRYENGRWYAVCRACGWRTEMLDSRKQARDAFRVLHGSTTRARGESPGGQ